MTSTDLLSSKQLAHALGRGHNYVWAMKLAGYSMQYGNRTTLAHALAWLEANPGFRDNRTVRGQAPKA